jgi:hypothetical protein
VHDIGTDVVKETRVVGNDHASDLRLVDEVVFEPSDGGDICEGGGGVHRERYQHSRSYTNRLDTRRLTQVVCRFVQQQDIGTDQHGPSQLQLHLPTSTETSHGVRLLLLGEPDLEQSILDLFPLGTLGDQILVSGDKVDNGQSRIFPLKRVLDHERSELILRRESLDLLIPDGFHQGGFTLSVPSTDTITFSTTKSERGMVEQEETTVGERELNITQHFTLTIVLLDLGSVLGPVDIHKHASDLLGDGLTLSLTTLQPVAERASEDPTDPSGFVPQPRVDQVGDHSTNVFEVVREDGRVGEVFSQGKRRVIRERHGHGQMREHELESVGGTLRDIPRRRDDGIDRSTRVFQDIQRGLSKRSDFRESGGRGNVLDTRDEGGEVSRRDVGVTDELDQVSNDDTGHSGGLGRSFLERTGEEGYHDGQGRSVDFGHKGGVGQGLDSGGNVGRGSHGGDEGTDVRDDIGVGQDGTEGSSGLLGLSRDLREKTQYTRTRTRTRTRASANREHH